MLNALESHVYSTWKARRLELVSPDHYNQRIIFNIVNDARDSELADHSEFKEILESDSAKTVIVDVPKENINDTALYKDLPAIGVYSHLAFYGRRLIDMYDVEAIVRNIPRSDNDIGFIQLNDVQGSSIENINQVLLRLQEDNIRTALSTQSDLSASKYSRINSDIFLLDNSKHIDQTKVVVKEGTKIQYENSYLMSFEKSEDLMGAFENMNRHSGTFGDSQVDIVSETAFNQFHKQGENPQWINYDRSKKEVLIYDSSGRTFSKLDKNIFIGEQDKLSLIGHGRLDESIGKRVYSDMTAETLGSLLTSGDIPNFNLGKQVKRIAMVACNSPADFAMSDETSGKAKLNVKFLVKLQMALDNTKASISAAMSYIKVLTFLTCAPTSLMA